MFAYRRRVLACERCGAAVEVAVGGGHAQCTRCGAPIVATARPETSVPRSPPMNEMERLHRLRQQDGRPLLPPAGLETLLQGGRIEPWKLNEARQIWGQTRAHLRTQPADIAAAERIVFLTMMLSNTLVGSGDDLGLRALYEGALEVLTLPRHRQTMRCYLARHAARTNDLESAEAWLAGCDPGSDDLMTDSAWRVTRAFLDTGYGRSQNVLQVLGGNDRDVPIDDSMDPVAAVLRANAWERMGNLDAARTTLARLMTSGQSASIEAVVKAMPPHWQVCAQSVEGARQQHRSHLGTKASSAGTFGWIFIVAGFIPLVAIVPVVLFSSGSAHFPVLLVLIFPLIFGGVGWKMVSSAKRAKKIAEEGLHGTAKILHVAPTGTRINNVPVMAFTAQVNVPGHPPVQCVMKKLFNPAMAGVAVGRDVPCVWHPQYPTEVVLDI
jgi:DNA-directed RNA polymerase subunit RPC12/RpoP